MASHSLSEQYAALLAAMRTRTQAPSVVPPPPTRPRELFNEEMLALVMALKVATSRMLAVVAQGAADPQEWLRGERALMEQALSPAKTDDFALDILARTRDHLDALFSEAAGLLPK